MPSLLNPPPPPPNDHLSLLMALNIIYKHTLSPTLRFIRCPFPSPLVVCTPSHPLQTLTQPLLLFRVNLLYLQTLLHTLKLYTLTLALALMHSVEPVIPSTFTHVTRYHDISLYNLPLKPPPS